MPTTVFVLGSPDCEMLAIECLLTLHRQPIAYAALDGRRVRPGEVSDGMLVWPSGSLDQFPDDAAIVAIEVAGPWGQPQIDHHHPHERATWGPERFLAASSIGQVISWLASRDLITGAWPGGLYYGAEPDGAFVRSDRGRGPWMVVGPSWVHDIPQTLVFEAAADHCPAAAVAGLCPGVDPVAFRAWYAESRRQFYYSGMAPEEYAQALAQSRQTLRAAPPVPELCPLLFVGLDDHPEERMEGALSCDFPRGRFVPPETPGEELLDGEPTDPRWRYVWRLDDDGVPVAIVVPPSWLHVRDLRHLPAGTVPAAGSGECYPVGFTIGIVAAALEGLGFVCHTVTSDGVQWLRSNGHGQGTAAGTRPAEVFLADPDAFGVVPGTAYGCPVRGFFGGRMR